MNSIDTQYSAGNVFTPGLTPTTPTTKRTVHAGFFRRFLAFVTDIVVISILLHLSALAALDGKAALLELTGEEIFGRLLFLFAFGYFLIYFYFIYFSMKGGQTPGKTAFNIKVTEQNGGDVGFFRALARVTGYSISAIFLMIGFLWPLIDRRRQAWHDKLAGTVVLEIS